MSLSNGTGPSASGFEIRAVSGLGSSFLGDLAMRGIAISYLMLASVGLSSTFLPFLCNMSQG
jgi:hypothetical protein